MKSLERRTPVRRVTARTGLLAGAALASLAPSPLADSDDYASQARIEATVAEVGQPFGVIVRSPLVGSLGVLTIGFSPAAIPLPGLPTVHVGPPYLFQLGAVGPTGLFIKAFSIPGSWTPGDSIYFQATVIKPGTLPGELLYYGTRGLRVSPSTSTPATFTSATVALDPVTDDFVASDVDAGDFNGDGIYDVMVAYSEELAAPALLITTQSPLALTDEAATRLPASALVPASVIEVGDVDNDGTDDVFLGSGVNPGGGSPRANQLLVNDGTGHFSAGTLPAGAGLPQDAVFGDLDGDGDLDLLVANEQDPDFAETPDPTVLYLNQGFAQAGTLGTFVASGSLAGLNGNNPHFGGGDLSVGDVDLDGDLDLFMARTLAGAGDQNLLYLNDGGGSFTDSTAASLPAIVNDSQASAFADVDNDGFLDILVANSDLSATETGNLLVHTGSLGTPVYTAQDADLPVSFGLNGDIRLRVEVGDVDSDGDLDALFGVHEFFPAGTAGDTKLLINQGGLQGGTLGEFAVDGAFGTASGLFIDADVALVDIDKDGALDVYVANGGDFAEVDPPQDVLLLNDL